MTNTITTVRKARVDDVPGMIELINQYAKQGLMLPKSLNQVYQSLQEFVVLEQEKKVIGCGALHVMWHDLAEIRSLAVAGPFTGNGAGGQIVARLLNHARDLGMPTVFALTYQADFFHKFGFHRVPKETLPRKIWADCLDCLKFPNCDEIAVILDIKDATAQERVKGKNDAVQDC